MMDVPSLLHVDKTNAVAVTTSVVPRESSIDPFRSGILVTLIYILHVVWIDRRRARPHDVGNLDVIELTQQSGHPFFVQARRTFDLHPSREIGRLIVGINLLGAIHECVDAAWIL